MRTLNGMPQKKRITILVALDSPLVELGLASMLCQAGVIGRVVVARSIEEMHAKLRELRPQVLLGDAAMLEGFEGAMGDDGRPTRVLILSTRNYITPDMQAMAAQACGFVPRQMALECVTSMLKAVSGCSAERRGSEDCSACVAPRSLRGPRLPLSAREIQVFERIGDGDGNQAIATTLGVSVKTVETYRENIKAKLGLDSSYALVRASIAWRRGELDLASLQCEACTANGTRAPNGGPAACGQLSAPQPELRTRPR